MRLILFLGLSLLFCMSVFAHAGHEHSDIPALSDEMYENSVNGLTGYWMRALPMSHFEQGSYFMGLLLSAFWIGGIAATFSKIRSKIRK